MLSTIGVYTLMYIGKFLIWLSLPYSPNHQIKYLNKVSHCVVSSFTSEDNNSITALPSLKYCRLGLLRTYSVHVFGVYKPLVSRIRKYALIENCVLIREQFINCPLLPPTFQSLSVRGHQPTMAII